MDDMLDNIMMYWLPAAATSSARLYWQSSSFFLSRISIDIPVGVTIFPKEIFCPSRRLAERAYSNVIYWNEVERGGHFAAFEQPELFVGEIRSCFRSLR
jgi:pimeloyl-ACP methyl ester carboxylesterase